MRSPLRRRPRSWFRPQVFILEGRLPLGDTVVGLLVGASLLPSARADVGWAESARPASGTAAGSVHPTAAPFVLLAEQGTSVFAASFTGTDAAATSWDALATAFGPAARRQRDALLTSPQREQGPESPPLLALRAGEVGASVQTIAVAGAPRASAPDSEGALLAALAGRQLPAAPATTGVTPAREAQVKESFGKLPLYFEENVGQTDASVHFFARGPGYGLFLTATEAVMVLQQPTREDSSDRAGGVSPLVRDTVGDLDQDQGAHAPRSAEQPPAVVRMQLVGANTTPTVTGRDEQPGKVNYFLGSDPAKWHTNVATFGRVEYAEVYPGIDLVWYGSNRQLEYDFVVSPGADPSAIRLNVSGTEQLELDGAGDLVLHLGEPGGVSPGMSVRQHKPFVYQVTGGVRQEVASRFVLEGSQVRFAVAAYDASRPLVIDPVLSYSTYLGGSGEDEGVAIAVDPATGDGLVTGETQSTNFPTANPLYASNQGGYDVFVTRLNAAGSALVWSTYLGGSSSEVGFALAVDPATGDALLTGSTFSTNFPTANPLQATNRGGSDVFVTRLNAAGSALVWSTYLGGSSDDQGVAIAVDPATGDPLVTGQTFSSDFPTINPLQASNRGLLDVFVTRLNATGSALVFSTYLGGSDNEAGWAIAVDPGSGDILVMGGTASTNFPTANPFQPVYGGGQVDALVARLNAAGSALVFSTYLGGSDSDFGHDLAVDPATGDALVTGYTRSINFPTANPLQASNRGDRDVFVTRLNAAGSALVFSTYLGGSGEDRGFGIAVDPASGDALLTGFTLSSNFPTANPLQAGNRGLSDVFVTRLNAAGSALVFSTYLGGSSNDYGNALAVDPTTGDAFITGETRSTNFPTANPFQPAYGGGFRDAFVTRIGSSPVAFYYIYPGTEGGVSVPRGEVLYVYILPFDANFNWLTDYRGTVTFYSPDPLSYYSPSYTFTGTEGGIGLGYVAFGTLGPQELYVWNPPVTVFGYAAYQVV